MKLQDEVGHHQPPLKAGENQLAAEEHSPIATPRRPQAAHLTSDLTATENAGRRVCQFCRLRHATRLSAIWDGDQGGRRDGRV